MVRITQDALRAGALLDGFIAGRTATGAVVSFTGLTRDRTGGVAVTRLILDAYPGLTEKVMAEIEIEARARFLLQDILAVHRWGPVDIGEPIIFVAVAAEHRRPAFEAADYLMDQFKTRAPFWKMEDTTDEARWIEPRPQDLHDLARWAKPDTPE